MLSNLVIIAVDKFAYKNNVYIYDHYENFFRTVTLWDEKNECYFQYTLDFVPDSAKILKSHIVKGGRI